MKWTESSIDSKRPLSSENVQRALSKLLPALKKDAISEIPVVSPLVHRRTGSRVIKTGHHLAFSPFAALGRQVFLLREPPPDIIRNKRVPTTFEARDEQKEHWKKGSPIEV